MAEANGEVALRDQDALVKEIERTREDLARTIDTLAERVMPANVARRSLSRATEVAQRGVSRVTEQASRPEVQLAAGAVVAAGAALFFLVRRRGRG